MAAVGQRRTMAGVACGMAAQVAPPAADRTEEQRERERDCERANAARARPKFTHAPSAASLLHSAADDKQVGGAGGARERERGARPLGRALSAARPSN